MDDATNQRLSAGMQYLQGVSNAIEMNNLDYHHFQIEMMLTNMCNNTWIIKILVYLYQDNSMKWSQPGNHFIGSINKRGHKITLKKYPFKKTYQQN